MVSAFLIGVMVGVICVGGLALGIRWLFRSRDESLPEDLRTRLGLYGVAMLVGQFVVAGLVLFYTPGLDENPLALALGLLSMNLLLPIGIGIVMKNKKESNKESDSGA